MPPSVRALSTGQGGYGTSVTPSDLLDGSHMASRIRATIAGTGSYVPSRVLSNAELTKMVDTTDEWIVERTGIRQRRVAADDESTSTMAARAAARACEDAGISPSELELIIVSTITPDHVFPATACLVQHAIGAKRAAAFDLQAACSGFLYGTHQATALIESGRHANVLVIGAETLSRIVDYTDRGSCILFGDGAGAVVFARGADGRGVMHSAMAADGSDPMSMCVPAGGSKLPASMATVNERRHYIHLEGRKVFKFATSVFIRLVDEAIAACGLSRDDVAMVVPHQVNQRIIEAAIRKLGLPREKFYVNIDRYGNTSAASVPIALDEARREGRIGAGDIVIMVAFGAGLAWGATVVKM